MTELRRASNRNGICVCQGNAGHDFVEPGIEGIIIDVDRRLLDVIDNGEAGHRIAIEHVDDIRLLRLGADHDRAVQVVTVATLMAQPGAKNPAHCEQQDDSGGEGDHDEATRQINLEDEYGDRNRTEHECRCTDDSLELLRAHAEDARVIRTAEHQSGDPGKNHDDDVRDVGRIIELNRIRNRPAKNETHDAGDQNRQGVKDEGAGRVHTQRVAAQVRTIAVGMSFRPADAGGGGGTGSLVDLGAILDHGHLLAPDSRRRLVAGAL